MFITTVSKREVLASGFIESAKYRAQKKPNQRTPTISLHALVESIKTHIKSAPTRTKESCHHGIELNEPLLLTLVALSPLNYHRELLFLCPRCPFAKDALEFRPLGPPFEDEFGCRGSTTAHIRINSYGLVSSCHQIHGIDRRRGRRRSLLSSACASRRRWKDVLVALSEANFFSQVALSGFSGRDSILATHMRQIKQPTIRSTRV